MATFFTDFTILDLARDSTGDNTFGLPQTQGYSVLLSGGTVVTISPPTITQGPYWNYLYIFAYTPASSNLETYIRIGANPAIPTSTTVESNQFLNPLALKVPGGYANTSIVAVPQIRALTNNTTCSLNIRIYRVP